jgi:hypothetical protein
MEHAFAKAVNFHWLYVAVLQGTHMQASWPRITSFFNTNTITTNYNMASNLQNCEIKIPLSLTIKSCVQIKIWLPTAW